MAGTLISGRKADPTDLASAYASTHATGLPRRLFELARDEDLGVGPNRGDATTRAMEPRDGERTIRASVISRTGDVVAGLACLPELLNVFNFRGELEWTLGDGTAIVRADPVATLRGPLSDVVVVERTMLNLLGRLSGVASLTARYVEAIEGTNAAIYDTRKTTPGLRVLEKYAVRCGGGSSHRMGLHDAVLIKDNHLAGVTDGDLAALVGAAAARARSGAAAPAFIQVEVDRLSQLDALLTLPAGVIDIILLDNMGPDLLREAVRRRSAARSAVTLEASGGVTLETVRAIAETGIERISVGALTHSARQADFGLDAADEPR